MKSMASILKSLSVIFICLLLTFGIWKTYQFFNFFGNAGTAVVETVEDGATAFTDGVKEGTGFVKNKANDSFNFVKDLITDEESSEDENPEKENTE